MSGTYFCMACPALLLKLGSSSDEQAVIWSQQLRTSSQCRRFVKEKSFFPKASVLGIFEFVCSIWEGKKMSTIVVPEKVIVFVILAKFDSTLASFFCILRVPTPFC